MTSPRTLACVLLLLAGAAPWARADKADYPQIAWKFREELRNVQFKHGDWARRDGWAKANALSIGCNQFLGGHAFQNTQGDLFLVAVGIDGNVYHSLDNGATWSSVTMHCTVLWDETYTVQFARWKDHLFITVGAANGDTQNLRYDSVQGAVYGVSVAAPSAAPTAADGGAGNLAAGDYYYLVTYYDATLGNERVDAFLREANPAAREAMAARFDEAIARGLWRPRRNSVARLMEKAS